MPQTAQVGVRAAGPNAAGPEPAGPEAVWKEAPHRLPHDDVVGGALDNGAAGDRTQRLGARWRHARAHLVEIAISLKDVNLMLHVFYRWDGLRRASRIRTAEAAAEAAADAATDTSQLLILRSLEDQRRRLARCAHGAVAVHVRPHRHERMSLRTRAPVSASERAR